MDQLQELIRDIPIRYNLYSMIILLGVVQAIFLAVIVWVRGTSRYNIHKVFSIILLLQGIVCLDIYLCYTGLMKYVIKFNDSTEPLVLLIPPLLFLFTRGVLKRKTIDFSSSWFHFIPAFVYFISQIPFYMQSNIVKMNAYLGAYFPDKGFLDVPGNPWYGYHLVKDEFRWYVLISFLTYLILSIRLLVKLNKEEFKQAAQHIRITKYAFVKNTLIVFLILFVIVFLVFLRFEDDKGDHYIAIVNTFLAFISTFIILSESRFFEKSWLADRYDSTPTNPKIDFRAIQSFVMGNDFYLNPKGNLSELSRELNVSSNFISKIINQQSGLNYNDFINKLRVAKARDYLLDPEFKHLTIEAIGLMVGFQSKSTFFSAFKKHTGLSPKKFIDQHSSN